MPTVQIPLNNADDDSRVTTLGTAYPPESTPSTPFVSTGETGFSVQRSLSGGTYRIQVGLLRFDSGSLIPDTATILSARLGLRRQTSGNADSRSLTAEYFSWTPPATTAMYTSTVGTNAHAGTPLANLTVAQMYWLDLTNVSNINTTDYTGFRLHISGVAPTGANFFDFRTYEGWLADNTISQPYLEVTYTTRPIHRASASAGTPSGSAQSTLTVNKPAGLAVDDWMVMAVSFGGGTGATITPPTTTGTWTLLTNGRQNSTTVIGQAVYAKKAVQADVDATSYTINLGANRKAAASISAYYNCDGVGQSSGQANVAATSVTAPTVTAELDSMLLYIAAVDSASTFSAPSGMTERVDVQGAQPAGASVAQTLYLGGALRAGTQFNAMQASAPTLGMMTPAQGWNVRQGVVGTSSQFDSQAEAANTSYTSNTTTPKPATPATATGNGWVSPSSYSGTFAAAAWTISILHRSATAAWAGRGRYRYRIFASQDSTFATGVRELTPATQITATQPASLLTTGNPVALSGTWTPGATITMDNEYLAITLAHEVTTADPATGNTKDVNLGVGTGMSIVTSTFTPAADAVTHTVAEEWRQTAGATGTRIGTATVADVSIGQSVTLIHPPPPDPAVLTPGIEYDPGYDYGALVELHGILAGFEGELLPGDFPAGNWKLFEYTEREWGATLASGAALEMYRVVPSSIISMTGFSGVVEDVQDDPESPDSNWLEVP